MFSFPFFLFTIFLSFILFASSLLDISLFLFCNATIEHQFLVHLCALQFQRA